MSLSELISKHSAHLLHVTNAYRGLEEKYALLDTMLFDEALVQKHKNRGFEVLRQALFFTCVVDIVNIACKKGGNKTPSIEGVASVFCNEEILKYFHDEIVNHEAFVGYPSMQEKQSQKFWENVGTTKAKIDCLLHSSQMEAFETIRDKRIAHLELKKSGDEYELIDISTLGLKWVDIKLVLDDITTIIENLNIVMTGSHISKRDEINQKMRDEFWKQNK